VKRPTRPSRWVLLALLATFAIAGAAEGWLRATYRPADLVEYIHVFVIAVLLFAWCKLDARERSLPDPRWAAFLVALIAPIGVLIYFFHTRPWRQALVSTLASLGYLALAVVTWAIAATIAGYPAI
jgi:hypothetical protein